MTGAAGTALRREEPALGFWLRYAEREGALVEDAGEQALLVLPQALQRAAGLPEEVTVTADPDVAEQDGAVLMIAGHPALERAAGAVLAEGDSGRAYLPWPASRPPARTTLQARARELVAVEHGRIDAAGEPAAAYAPLLRAGAMIDYAASLTLRFQEQEEVWVDARTGVALSTSALASVRGRALLGQPEQREQVLPADLPLALAGAHEQLGRRAGERLQALAAHARRSLAAELQRAEAYYDAALQSIARRRETAPAERRRMLDAQAQATQTERARRRREIEEQFAARHDIRPFRLHLVHVPAFVLPIDVRRGAHRFPFALVWLAGAGEFAPARCPACGAAQELVAGRDRLGCASCVPRATQRRAPALPPLPASAQKPETAPSPPHAPGSPAGPVLDPVPAPVPPSDTRGASPREPGTSPREPGAPAGSPEPKRAPAAKSRVAGRRPPPAPPSAALRARAAAPRRSGEAIERTGNKLAFALWQQLADGEHAWRKKLQRDSPLRALHRVYGRAAPLYAVGIPPGVYPTEVTSSTYPARPGFPQLTAGEARTGEDTYRYTVLWSLRDGRPAIGELMPAPHPLVFPPAHGDTAALFARLHGHAPEPLTELDAVAELLWRVELPSAGLPFTARCLATWWRVQSAATPTDQPAVLAAAVAAAVTRAAALARRRTNTPASYDADPQAVSALTRRLGAALRLDGARGW